MSAFTVYPAIDLRRGQVVRLAQGDPSRQTTYSADPAQTARRFLEAGASWLHVVNLDGALEQDDTLNHDALGLIFAQTRQIAGAAPQVQLGGGLRSLQHIAAALAGGASRIVLGTAAVQDPHFAENAVHQFGPERIAVSIDARQGRVRLRGWREGTPLEPLGLAARMAELGVRTLIYTDIARDGVGSGPDIETASAIAAAHGIHVIAAGGVASLEHIRLARQAGLSGVIVGRALYDGSFSLAEALTC